MTLVDKHELERHAAAMVVAELGAVRAVRRDVRPATGMRDYDIVFADGDEEPLEVTSNFDQVVMNAIARAEGGGFELPADIKRYWMVSGSETYTDETQETRAFDRERVSELLRPVVEQLERAGVTYFDTDRLAWPTGGRGPAGYEQPGRELHDLGITRGLSATATPDNARIDVRLGRAGSFGPDSISEVLEDIAALPDNIAKLEVSADANRRHLFVRLATSGSADMAGFALADFLRGWIWDDQPRLPNLPDAITTIWAGNRTGGIYATPPDGWRRFGEVDA